MSRDSTTDAEVKTVLRLPDWLHEILAHDAKLNSRSLNGELIHILKNHIESDERPRIPNRRLMAAIREGQSPKFKPAMEAANAHDLHNKILERRR